MSRRYRTLDRTLGDLVVGLAVSGVGEVAPATEPTIAVVIPAYNEADGIVEVLHELPTTLAGMRVEPVVVVDGGTDDTAVVARAAGFVTAVHPVNRGQGDALRTGFAIALARGAEIVMTMDADGQHRPDQMIDLVTPLLEDRADYVQGSRFLGDYDDAGGARDLGIRGFTLLINRVGGTSITDCTNGFRAIRAKSLSTMQLTEPRFSAPEILIEASRQGLRMLEVPVHIRSRSHGESKKPRRLGYPLGFLGVIARSARRGRAA
ncbi:MAG: glycosyltransferase family 2 protein [Acidimicrobiia bacterium]